MVWVGIALGSNLQDPIRQLKRGADAIQAKIPLTQFQMSDAFETKPAEGASGPNFFNAACVFETSQDCDTLFKQLQSIEHEAGRFRPFRNAPRTLDLDLLFYGTKALDTANLQLPHPRLSERWFVLAPLRQLMLPKGALPDSMDIKVMMDHLEHRTPQENVIIAVHKL